MIYSNNIREVYNHHTVIKNINLVYIRIVVTVLHVQIIIKSVQN